MHNHHKTSAPVLSQGYPVFLAAAMLFVNDGDGEMVKKNFGGTVEADPVFAQVLPGLVRVLLNIIAQCSSTFRLSSGVCRFPPTIGLSA